jgi:hypothetical protein
MHTMFEALLKLPKWVLFIWLIVVIVALIAIVAMARWLEGTPAALSPDGLYAVYITDSYSSDFGTVVTGVGIDRRSLPLLPTNRFARERVHWVVLPRSSVRVTWQGARHLLIEEEGCSAHVSFTRDHTARYPDVTVEIVPLCPFPPG